MRRWSFAETSKLKSMDIRTAMSIIYLCDVCIYACMKQLLRQRTYFITYSRNQHCNGRISFEFVSVNYMSQTQRRGTACRRILTDIPAWVSFCEERIGGLDERRAEFARERQRPLSIAMRRDKRSVESRCNNLFIMSQN